MIAIDINSSEVNLNKTNGVITPRPFHANLAAHTHTNSMQRGDKLQVCGGCGSYINGYKTYRFCQKVVSQFFSLFTFYYQRTCKCCISGLVKQKFPGKLRAVSWSGCVASAETGVPGTMRTSYQSSCTIPAQGFPLVQTISSWVKILKYWPAATISSNNRR